VSATPSGLIGDAATVARSLGGPTMAVGRPCFFDEAVRALRSIVDFRNSDMVIVPWAAGLEEPPTLVGLYSQQGRYARAIRERYLPYGFRVCPGVSAIRAGLHSGVHSMAELGGERFLRRACYDAYFRSLEARNFYSVYGDLGDGRVVCWSISRHLDDADFNCDEDAALRALAPLLIGLITRHCQLAVVPDRALPDAAGAASRPTIDETINALAREPLTRREREVACLLARGLTTKTLSQQLRISPQTEVVHRRNIFRKLGISSQIELLSYCLNGATPRTGRDPPSR
jgi:DNA-binding CsgD family transcriptional regulator